MMRRTIKEKVTNQQGEVMLEAAIIMVPILILLMVLLSLSFLFYQEAMMVSVATEISADVAKNYKYAYSGEGESDYTEIGNNAISIDEIDNVPLFRMSFGMKKLGDSHDIRAKQYVGWRIAATSLGLNPQEPEVDCTLKSSGLGRAYVETTVSQPTDFFLSGVMELAGVADETTLFSATAYAECVDMMAYTSAANFTAYFSDRFYMFEAIGTLYGEGKDLIDNFEGLLDRIQDLFS